MIKSIYAALLSLTLLPGVPTANGELGDLFASLTGTGVNGGGFVYRYTSTGTQSVVASGLSRPSGVVVDHFGNLFVATTTLNGKEYEPTILKITPTGWQTTFASVGGNVVLLGLASDQSGNLFAVAQDVASFTSTIYKFTPDGVQSPFGSFPSDGFGIAFDEMGNLFAADAFDQTIFKFEPDGTRSVFVGPSAFATDTGPAGLAFDRFGNLFVSTESTMLLTGNDTILKFTPDGVERTFAAGLTYPRGLAFDRSGNLFVADVKGAGSGAPGQILKFTPDGTWSLFAVVPAESNTDPQFLAFQLLPTARPRPSPHPRPQSAAP